MARQKPSKAQLPTLDTGPVSLLPIRDLARKHLLDAIDSLRGKKMLILDNTLSGPISLLDANLSEVFSEHGVVKLIHLEKKRLDDISYNQVEPRLSDVRNVIYLVRATIENAQAVASQIKQSRQGLHEFQVFFIPRRSIVCERVFEAEGVYGDVTFAEFPLEMVPYDDDVISLDLDFGLRDYLLHGDTAPLYFMARAILSLQSVYGTIPRIQGKGAAALLIKDMLVRLHKEQLRSAPEAGAGRIDRLVLVDREVDMVTPMVSQITFEGLIDEVTGIKHGAVPWQQREKKEGGDNRAAAWGTVLLNSSDTFFKEFRDLPYYITSQRLQQYARDARREYTELASKDLGELKTFVKGLPKLMALDRLSDLASPVAERVKQQLFHDQRRVEADIIDNYELEGSVEFIQEMMWRGTDLMGVLRLIVLLSATNGGLSRKHYDSLRMDLLHSYGHEHITTLNALEGAGLIKLQGSSGRGSWAAVRKALKLVAPAHDQEQMNALTDIAQLYGSYAPLSVKLVEQALKGGWSPVTDVLSLLPGPAFDVAQISEAASVDKSPRPPSSSAGRPETVLVAFIGGATFSEVSALRVLGTLRSGPPVRFLTLTSKLINGSSMLKAFVDPLALQGVHRGATL